MSFYAVLHIGEEASPAEIRRAYLDLAREHHPDLNPENSEARFRFKVILRAYEVLSDPHQRRKYDVDPSQFGSGLDRRGTQYSRRDAENTAPTTPSATSYALRRSRKRGLRRVLTASSLLCLAGLIAWIVLSIRTSGPDGIADRDSEPVVARAEDHRLSLVTPAKPLRGRAAEAESPPSTIPKPLLTSSAVPIADYVTTSEGNGSDTGHESTMGPGNADAGSSPVTNSDRNRPGTVRLTGSVQPIGDFVEPVGIDASMPVPSPLAPLGRMRREASEDPTAMGASVLTDSSHEDFAWQSSDRFWPREANAGHGSSGLSRSPPSSTTRLPPIDLSTRQAGDVTWRDRRSNTSLPPVRESRLSDQQPARRSTRFSVSDTSPRKGEFTRATRGKWRDGGQFSRDDGGQIGRDTARRPISALGGLPSHPAAWRSEPAAIGSSTFGSWHPLAPGNSPGSSVDAAAYRPGGAGLGAAMRLGQHDSAQIAVWSPAGWTRQSWSDGNRTRQSSYFGLGTTEPYADLNSLGTQDNYGTTVSNYPPVGDHSTGAIPATTPRQVPAYSSGPPSARSWGVRPYAYK